MVNRRKAVAGGLAAAALAATFIMTSPASAQIAPNDPNVHEVVLPAVVVAIGVGAFFGGALLGGALAHPYGYAGPYASYPVAGYPPYPGCYLTYQRVWNGYRYMRERARICN